MSVLSRNNVTASGAGSPTLVFAHGLACDQRTWRFIVPAFEPSHRVVLIDHIGCGNSAPDAYDRARYSTLHGYASDVVDVCEALDLTRAVLVGHGFGAMVGLLAAIKDPRRIGALVLLAPSPRFVDENGYHGGMSRADADAALAAIDRRADGWTRTLAARLAGAAAPATLLDELASGLERIETNAMSQLARVAFLSDVRADLAHVRTPALLIHDEDDPLSPPSAVRYVEEHVPGARRVPMPGAGHYPHLTAPDRVVNCIREVIRDHDGTRNAERGMRS